jgi:hypothetical protein
VLSWPRSGCFARHMEDPLAHDAVDCVERAGRPPTYMSNNTAAPRGSARPWVRRGRHLCTRRQQPARTMTLVAEHSATPRPRRGRAEGSRSIPRWASGEYCRSRSTVPSGGVRGALSAGSGPAEWNASAQTSPDPVRFPECGPRLRRPTAARCRAGFDGGGSWGSKRRGASCERRGPNRVSQRVSSQPQRTRPNVGVSPGERAVTRPPAAADQGSGGGVRGHHIIASRPVSPPDITNVTPYPAPRGRCWKLPADTRAKCWAGWQNSQPTRAGSGSAPPRGVRFARHVDSTETRWLPKASYGVRASRSRTDGTFLDRGSGTTWYGAVGESDDYSCHG